MPLKQKPHIALRWTGIAAVLVSLCAIGAAGATAHLMQISGAVVASGQVVVRGKPKTVQHLEGGIVDRLMMQDGQRVKKGQVLLRLDQTLLQANLKIYETRLITALALRARLRAEEAGRDQIIFDAPLPLLKGIDQKPAQKRQIRIFDSRSALRAGRRAQLSEKIVQFQNQVRGVKALLDAKRVQIEYIDQELSGLQQLLQAKMIPQSKVMSVRRSRADLFGQIGEHEAEIARIKNSIQDTKIELLQIDRQTQEEASREIDTVTASISELILQITSTRVQLSRVEVTSPTDGIVHEMQTATVGGIVAPGAAIMQIIPTGNEMEFEVRVDPASIDQVSTGQETKLLLSAFNQRTTPELTGRVRAVSANTVRDESTGVSYYKVWIVVSPREMRRLGDLEIVPGMPAEAFIRTGDRSILSYIAKPMTDHLHRAFRED